MLISFDSDIRYEAVYLIYSFGYACFTFKKLQMQ